MSKYILHVKAFLKSCFDGAEWGALIKYPTSVLLCDVLREKSSIKSDRGTMNA